jgi:hypothetical protein
MGPGDACRAGDGRAREKDVMRGLKQRKRYVGEMKDRKRQDCGSASALFLEAGYGSALKSKFRSFRGSKWSRGGEAIYFVALLLVKHTSYYRPFSFFLAKFIHFLYHSLYAGKNPPKLPVYIALCRPPAP